MIINDISLQNFIGYKKKCSIDFAGRKTIGIVGANEAGKSSILQAVCYGLYGRTRADREVQLISDGAKKDLVVQLGVTMPDGKKLEIERGRTRKNEAILNVKGMSGKVTEVSEQLLELLQLSYDDFIALSYFVQGDIHQFMTGNKRDYFQRWTAGLKLWAEYEAEAAQECDDVNDVLGGNRYDQERCEEIISKESEIKRVARSTKSALQSAEQEVRLNTEQVQTLTTELKLAEQKSKLQEDINIMALELKDVGRDLRRLEADLAVVQRTIKDIAGGKCPMLEIACDDLALASVAQRDEETAKLNKLIARRTTLKKREVRLSARLDQLIAKKDSDDTTKLNDQLHCAKKDLKESDAERKERSHEYAIAHHELGELKKAKEKLVQLKAERKKLEVQHRRWQFVKFMCGRSGIPSLLIERELERVEDKCNWVLERLGYQKRIKFSGFKQLASYEAVCQACGGEDWSKKTCKGCGAPRPHKRKNEPTVTVLDNLVERPFTMESGGAQVLQSFAVRLACGLFVSSMTGVPMRMIMLDEVFAMLDASNRQKLLSLVIDKLTTEFGLSQQFVVSHQEEVANSVDDLLVVTKGRGGSTAQWG